MTVRYTETAIDEIEQILSYIAADNFTAAYEVADAIEKTILDILYAPAAAPLVYGPDVRAKMIRGGYEYRIFSTHKGRDLIIRNVRSNRRELPM